MQILSNNFPINWESAKNDYYLCLNKSEILYLINNNTLFIDEMNKNIQDFLKREDHMRNTTTMS